MNPAIQRSWLIVSDGGCTDGDGGYMDGGYKLGLLVLPPAKNVILAPVNQAFKSFNIMYHSSLPIVIPFPFVPQTQQ